MVFYIVRYDGDRLYNDMKFNLLAQFIARDLQNVADPLYNFIDELGDNYIQALFSGCGYSIGSRSRDDYDMLKKTIYENNGLNNDSVVYIFASIEEIERFIREEVASSLKSDEFDILKLTTETNSFNFEEIELFQSSFQEKKSIEENLQSLIKSKLYPEICNEQSSKLLEEYMNLSEIISLRNRSEKVLENLKCVNIGQEDKVSHFIDKKISEIVEQLKKVSVKESQTSKYLQDIITNLQFEANICPDRTDELIKYPSVFSPDNLCIEQRQSEDNRSIIFIVTNTTTYYLYNVSIVLIQASNREGEIDNNYGTRIAEIPLIEPRTEKVEFNSPYNYSLLEKLGYYTVQAFYHSQVISNSVYISRINILDIVARKGGALIKLRNNHIDIEILIEYTRNGASKQMKAKLGNFETKDNMLTGISSGDVLNVKVFSQKEKILLCPEYHKIVS